MFGYLARGALANAAGGVLNGQTNLCTVGQTNLRTVAEATGRDGNKRASSEMMVQGLNSFECIHCLISCDRFRSSLT